MWVSKLHAAHLYVTHIVLRRMFPGGITCFKCGCAPLKSDLSPNHRWMPNSRLVARPMPAPPPFPTKPILHQTGAMVGPIAVCVHTSSKSMTRRTGSCLALEWGPYFHVARSLKPRSTRNLKALRRGHASGGIVMKSCLLRSNERPDSFVKSTKPISVWCVFQ